MTEESNKLTVVLVKKIQKETELDQVIILGWEAETHTTHFASYGKTKEDCRQAAKGIENLNIIFKYGIKKVLKLIEEANEAKI